MSSSLIYLNPSFLAKTKNIQHHSDVTYGPSWLHLSHPTQSSFAILSLRTCCFPISRSVSVYSVTSWQSWYWLLSRFFLWFTSNWIWHPFWTFKSTHFSQNKCTTQKEFTLYFYPSKLPTFLSSKWHFR